jgi:hypothetical protein
MAQQFHRCFNPPAEPPIPTIVQSASFVFFLFRGPALRLEIPKAPRLFFGFGCAAAL